MPPDPPKCVAQNLFGPEAGFGLNQVGKFVLVTGTGEVENSEFLGDSENQSSEVFLLRVFHFALLPKPKTWS